MTTNVEQYAVGVAKYAFWAVKNGAYPYGATGTLANGSDSGMQRHKGLASASLAFPDVPRSTILGDGGKMGEFLGQVVDTSDATITFNTFDMNFSVASDGRSIYADGDHDAVMFSTNCQNYANLCMVLNAKAQSFSSGSLGEDQWVVLIIFDCEAAPNIPNLDGTAFDAQPVTYNLSLDEVDTEHTGLTVSSGNYGVSQASVKMFASENPVAVHTFIGDGADTTVVLDYTPAAENGDKVRLWIDGTEQTYTTNYTVSGTTLTFGVAPSAGEVCVVQYEFTDTC